MRKIKRKKTAMFVPVEQEQKEPINHREVLYQGIQLFYLALAVYCLIFWLFTMLEVTVDTKPVLISIGVTILCARLLFVRKYGAVLRVLVLGAFLFFCFWQRVPIEDGFRQIADKALDCVEKYHSINLVSVEYQQVSGALTCVSIVLAFVFSCFIGIDIFQKVSIKTTGLFFVLFLAGSLSVDCFPQEWTVLGALVATLGIHGSHNGGQQSNLQKRKSLQTIAGCYVLALLVLIVGVCGYIGAPKMYPIVQGKATDVQAWRQYMIEEVLPGIGEKVGETGRKLMGLKDIEESEKLSNAAPVQSDRVVLTLNVDHRPENPVYLKGFVGGEFQVDKSSWDGISEVDFEASVEQWLERGFVGEREGISKRLEGRLNSLLSETGRKGVRYEIEYKRTGDQYAYLPYGATPFLQEPEPEYYADGMLTRNGSKTVSCMGYDIDEQQIVEGLYGSASDLEYVYGDYVLEQYTRIPNGLDRLQREADSIAMKMMNEGQTYIAGNIVRRIRTVLRENCVYEQNDLESVPADSNYPEFFYFEQKRGYCTHFATTAVLLIRSMGVPARYVSGYMVDPFKFEKDNGTGSYLAEVTGKDAHAWIEYYDYMSQCWIPFEVTPGSIADGPEEESTQVSTEEEESTSIPSTEPESSELPEETVEEVTVGNIGRTLLRILGGVIGILFLCLGIVLQKRIRIKRRETRITRGSRSNRLQNMAREMERMLKAAGIKAEQEIDDPEYARLVQEALPELEEGLFIQFIETVLEAKYSREEKTSQQVQRCLKTYRTVNDILSNRKEGWKKWWWNNIRCY